MHSLNQRHEVGVSCFKTSLEEGAIVVHHFLSMATRLVRNSVYIMDFALYTFSTLLSPVEIRWNLLNKESPSGF